jgi:uncharacterized membrane protein YadS
VPLVAGVLFTFAVAELGILLAKLPGFSRFGSMISAILIAVLYRQSSGILKRYVAESQFSAKLSSGGHCLFGFRLNLATVMREGLGLLVKMLAP